MMSEVEETGKVHASTDSHIVSLNDVKIDASGSLSSSRQGDIKVYINVVPSEVNQRKRRAVKEEFDIDWSSFHYEYISNKRGALYFIEGVCSLLIIIFTGTKPWHYNVPELINVFAGVSLAFCLVNIIFNVFFLDCVSMHMAAKGLELIANLLLVAFHLANFILDVGSDEYVDVAILSIILTMLFLVSTFFSLQDAGCCKELPTGEPLKAKRKLAVKRKKKIKYSRLGKR